MLFGSYLEVLVSGCSFFVWAWSILKVTRMGTFVSLVSQALQGWVKGEVQWGWSSVYLSATPGVHIDLITPSSYFVLTFQPFWRWNLLWGAGVDELQGGVLMAARRQFPWLLGLYLYTASHLHLISTLGHSGTCRQGRLGVPCLMWGVGWGVRHQKGPSGGHWCWLLFSKSLSKYSEYACTLQFHHKSTGRILKE